MLHSDWEGCFGEELDFALHLEVEGGISSEDEVRHDLTGHETLFITLGFRPRSHTHLLM